MAKKQTKKKKPAVKPLDDPANPHNCPKGKIWNPITQQCVDSIG